MKWKTFFSKYGLMFTGSYLVAFLVLVTIYKRIQFTTFPGDLLIKEPFLLYLPFVSSLGVAVFVTVMFEAYRIFKHY